MDFAVLAAVVRCRRLKRLELERARGVTPQDLVMLLDLLWGLYGDGPFDMVLDAGKELQQEARAVAVSKGWCAEGREARGIKLRW